MLHSVSLMIPSRMIHITNSVYQTMIEYAQSSPKREVIGVLFGKVNDKNDVCFQHAHPFRIGRMQDVHFIDEDYERVYKLIKKYDPLGLKWLGWFHSHPFKGGDHIYMSNTDVKYHSNAQNGNPFWTAIVINPHQITDPSTFHGIRAYRTDDPPNPIFKQKKVIELEIQFSP